MKAKHILAHHHKKNLTMFDNKWEELYTWAQRASNIKLESS